MSAENEPPDDGALWFSLTKIAELKGRAPQTIHERVHKLAADGLLEIRPGPRGSKLVNIAEFDQFVGETTDFSKQQAAATRAANDSGGEQSGPAIDTRFTDSQRDTAHYTAKLKAIEYGKQSRQLVSVASVKRDVEKLSNAFIGSLDGMVLRAEEATAAALKDGIPGVRQVLADAVFKIRTAFATALRELETASRADDGDGVEITLADTDSEPPQ